MTTSQHMAKFNECVRREVAYIIATGNVEQYAPKYILKTIVNGEQVDKYLSVYNTRKHGKKRIYTDLRARETDRPAFYLRYVSKKELNDLDVAGHGIAHDGFAEYYGGRWAVFHSRFRFKTRREFMYYLASCELDPDRSNHPPVSTEDKPILWTNGTRLAVFDVSAFLKRKAANDGISR